MFDIYMFLKVSTRLFLVFGLNLFILSCQCQKSSGVNTSTQLSTDDEKNVNLFIWSEFTSPDVLRDFKNQTGITVNESNFSADEELLAKLQAGATGYDIVIPSDFMTTIMIKLNLLQKLDKSLIPNAQDILPELINLDFDPGNIYSLPYSWAVTGFAYSNEVFKTPVTGWKDLFSRPEAKNKVSLLDDTRDTIGVALILNKQSIDTVNPQHLAKAKSDLIALKSTVKSFNSTPMQSLLSGEVVAAQIYSNEGFLAREKSGQKFEFVFPSEGAILGIDNFAIPATARNPKGAHKLINFLLGKAAHVQFVNRMFAGPVLSGIGDLLSPQLKANSVLTDFKGLSKKALMKHDLGEGAKLYDRVWTEVKASR